MWGVNGFLNEICEGLGIMNVCYICGVVICDGYVVIKEIIDVDVGVGSGWWE